jgi:hypothetical protein
MDSTDVVKAVVWEDGGATVLARVLGNSGAAITQASLTGISYKVFDLQSATPDTAIATGTVTVATSVFDTLQTDAIWSADSTGYNFKHALAATCFPNGDRTYRVEYLFDPASGENFWLVCELSAKAVRTS